MAGEIKLCHYVGFVGENKPGYWAFAACNLQIDIKKASWTMRESSVTCPACKAWLAKHARA